MFRRIIVLTLIAGLLAISPGIGQAALTSEADSGVALAQPVALSDAEMSEVEGEFLPLVVIGACMLKGTLIAGGAMGMYVLSTPDWRQRGPDSFILGSLKEVGESAIFGLPGLQASLQASKVARGIKGAQLRKAGGIKRIAGDYDRATTVIQGIAAGYERYRR